MSDKTIELERCPWCDSDAIMIQTIPRGWSDEVYRERCQKCQCSGPIALIEAKAAELWNRRANTPADPVREAATALELPSIEDANQWKRGQAGVFISPELEGYVAKLMSDYAMEVLARSGYFDGRDCKGDV